jgi:hypothetical protein
MFTRCCTRKAAMAFSGRSRPWKVCHLARIRRRILCLRATGDGGARRVFVDHTGLDKSRKFKLIYNEKGKGAGPSLASSPDGRSWKIERHYGSFWKGDCQLNVLYDQTRGMWQLIGRPRVVSEMYPNRSLTGVEKLNAPKYNAIRRIAIAESKDLQNWSFAREVFRPNHLSPFTEMDNMSAFEQQAFGFCQLFHR